MHTHIERERERERGRALRNMDVQTHARQGPAHVRTDVVHGEAPCITHAHGADLCPPGLKGAAQPPAASTSLRAVPVLLAASGDPFLPAINPRQKQATGGWGSICGAV